MKTPAEARKTWCPWARRVLRNESAETGEFAMVGSANRLDENGLLPGDPRCIAEECSQWVWVGENIPNPDGVDSNERPHAAPQSRGFCGRNVAMAMKVFGK